MRGDDVITASFIAGAMGAPPHARGRHPPPERFLGMARNTPACAGTTRPGRPSPSSGGEHPRMRGDDRCMVVSRRSSSGTPPHARGRFTPEVPFLLGVGSTPACAGTTNPARPSATRSAEHPRMRGDDRCQELLPHTLDGAPPHARGRHGEELQIPLGDGSTPPRARGRPRRNRPVPRPARNTPACAGTTVADHSGPGWEHTPACAGTTDAR